MKALICLAPVITVAVFTSLGCMTRISVKKAEPGDKTEGIRYSLPATFLIGTPKEDGTISYKFEYLPDEQATYAVDATSFLTKHKLDVSIVDGLLKKVESTQHGDDVAKALIDSGGNVQSELTKERKKQQKEAADEVAKKTKDLADAAAKKVADAGQKVVAATTALEAAKIAEIAAADALKKAEYALTLTPADNRNAQLIIVRNAEIDLATAQAKRQSAESALSAAQAAEAALSTTAATPAAGNTGSTVSGGNTGIATGGTPKPTAWGPVVYRVLTTQSATVTLVPVQFDVTTKGQMRFETSKAVKPPSSEPPAPLFTLASGAVATLPADGGFSSLEVNMTSEINRVRSVKLLKSDNTPTPTSIAPLFALQNRTTVKIFLRPETPENTYILEVAVEYGDPKTSRPPASDSFNIAVRKEPPKK